ncbi:hypothetical protein D920_00235 [Enterococcus faecalis 13-SD-W-01]|nr:hypothetical protein D920_00235 [Enterococcus faecalis 13-SD-W-01]
MLADIVLTPEDYLAYSEQELFKSCILENYKKINTYYSNLCLEFKQVYENEENLFQKWGQLLAVDAQIQILLELSKIFNGKLPLDLSEDELVNMIRHDKSSFYREITGGNMKEPPKWGLIYLSEE